MAATTTVLHLLSPGDRVVTVNDLYGGTYRIFTKVYEPKGYLFEFVSAEDASTRLADALDERTRMVWVETPTNPLMSIVDLRAVVEAAHAAGALVVVDNTFATPYLQRPLELGADLVVHSTTKYLGGHSDVIGGFASTNDPTIAERLQFLQNALGGVPGPFDSWLVLRGLRTLASPHAPALRERTADRGAPRDPSRSRARPLPRPREPPRSASSRPARWTTSAG